MMLLEKEDRIFVVYENIFVYLYDEKQCYTCTQPFSA